MKAMQLASSKLKELARSKVKALRDVPGRVVIAIIASVVLLYAWSNYGYVRNQRDDLRDQVRINKQIQRRILPLTARQQDALDRWQRELDNKARAACGEEGWKEFDACAKYP